MVALMPSRTVSVSIARAPATVYDFIVEPENLPEWAPGLARSVRKSGNDWFVETSDGPMRIEFVARNQFGVADHRVTVRPGLEVLNPMRVLTNGDGAEVVFTLFQTPDMSAEEFEADSAQVESDLQMLKRALEIPES
jgi:hypothetical protein